MCQPHNAGLLVESFQNLIPVWGDVPRNEKGLTAIIFGKEWLLLEKWYEGELMTVLIGAGDSPMQLPRLAALGNSPEGSAEQCSDFAPQQALAKLILWDGALSDEDERLLEMETKLRSTTELWRRENLFVQWQLSHSASPQAIARREEHRQGLVHAQWEFADALEQRDPAIAAVYRRSRDAYHEAKEARAWIGRTKAINGKGYSPKRVAESWDDARRHHEYITYLFFEIPKLHWAMTHTSWTDPAHKDWVPGELRSWEHTFAYRLMNTGRPNTDSNNSQ